MKSAVLVLNLLGAFWAQAQSSGPGAALLFNGASNSYAVIQHDPSLNPYPLTVTAWVKTTPTRGSAGLVNKYISGAFNGWQIYLDSGQVRAWYFADSANYVWDGGSGLNGGTVANGNWHHLAFTVDASGGKLYVDGSLRDFLPWTGTAAAATARQELRLGNYPGVGPISLTGTLDEITVWNTSLSQAQIQANMHQSLSGTNAGLELYLRLDDAPGNVIYDSTGHGHDGLLVNSPTWLASTAPLSSSNSDLTVQPLSRVVEAGTPVSFSVATAAAPATYQWRFNGQDILGATGSTYLQASVTPTNAGLYDVTVGTLSGSVTSAPAELRLVTVPELLAQPVGEMANEGSGVTFAPQTLGGRPLTHFWYHAGSLASSSALSSLSLQRLRLSDAGDYQLVASNSFGAVTSSVAVLKVYSGPITSNLVAHLTFDNHFADSSGRHNDGRYADNGTSGDDLPTFAVGEIGPASQFSTSQYGSKFDYITLGYPPDLQLGTNDFSVSFWVNYNNQGGDLPFISNKDWNRSHNSGWAISAQSAGTFRVNFTGPNQGADMFSTAQTPVVRNGAWHHIAVSVLRVPPPQSAFVYVYADGALVSKSPMSLAGTIDTLGLPFTYASPISTGQTNWALNLGQDGTGVYYDMGGAYNLAAKLDDLGIWRRALTPEEAKGIYTVGLESRDLTQTPEYSNLRLSLSGGNVFLAWAGSPTVKLQTTPTLNPPAWTDVPATLGQSSAGVQLTASGAFFRLAR